MLRCIECKSKDVDVMAWVNINTSECNEDIDGHEPYCNICKEEVQIEEDTLIKTKGARSE